MILNPFPIIEHHGTMSKRRITKKQSTRIRDKQETFHQQFNEHAATANGLVITRFGSHALIEDDSGNHIRCSIRPSIDSLIAGDKVIWLAESHQQGVVVSRHPRQAVLGRPDKHGAIKPVAANITQMIIVVAPKPEIAWPLLDSYLVIAEYSGINACIVLNKIDLDDSQIKSRLQQQYESLGYPVLLTSTKSPELAQDLLNQLSQQVSVFVGQSGVGKSSLIAQVLPHETNIQTAAISIQSELGRHTTSNSFFYHIPTTDGALIDSPGVREFGLWHMSANEIAHGYREFIPYISSCKFRDCKHENTPGCALLNALKHGLIARDRYTNFIKIVAQFS